MARFNSACGQNHPTALLLLAQPDWAVSILRYHLAGRWTTSLSRIQCPDSCRRRDRISGLWWSQATTSSCTILLYDQPYYVRLDLYVGRSSRALSLRVGPGTASGKGPYQYLRFHALRRVGDSKVLVSQLRIRSFPRAKPTVRKSGGLLSIPRLPDKTGPAGERP